MIFEMIPTEYLGLIMLGLLLVTIFIGFPIAFTLMLLAVVFGYMGMEHRVFRLMVSQTFGIMQEEVLAAIPLFVLMGFFLERTGLMERLFRALQLAMGGLPGSLYLVTLLTATVFATATGIIGASVTVIGLLAVPVMLKYGYYPRLAAGVVCAGGTLGILIPPSIMLVLMADRLSVPEASVGDLFMGAFFPGLMLGALYVAYAMIRPALQPSIAPLPANLPKIDAGVLRDVALAVLPTAALILGVLGSIFAGIATPTEASGVGALGAMLLALAARRLTLPVMRDSLYQTTRTSAFIFAIFLGATAFSVVLRGLGGDEVIKDVLLGLPFGPYGIVLTILGAVFLLGFFLDWVEITLIILPLVAPVVQALDFNLVWFTILFAMCLQTSFLTPPVGFALFYIKGVAPPEIKVTDIYRGVAPYIAIQLLALMLVFFMPGIATWLPGVAYN